MASAFERDLPDASWPTSVAELAAQGVSAEMRRNRRWRRSSRGFFVQIISARHQAAAGGAHTG